MKTAERDLDLNQIAANPMETIEHAYAFSNQGRPELPAGFAASGEAGKDIGTQTASSEPERHFEVLDGRVVRRLPGGQAMVRVGSKFRVFNLR